MAVEQALSLIVWASSSTTRHHLMACSGDLGARRGSVLCSGDLGARGAVR